MNSLRMRVGSVALVAWSLAACDNAGFDLGFPDQKANVVRAFVYLDRDGSRTVTATIDTVYAGARVALLRFGTTDTVRTVTSDQLGIAQFNDVALGDYTVAVSPTELGDSVLVTSIDTSVALPSTNKPTADIKIRSQNDTTDVLIRLSYPEVSLRAARNTAPGKRVFVRGIVLAPYPLFRDGSAYLSDTSSQIRLVGVVLRAGLAQIVPGDSVTVLGLTASQLGQPTLDQSGITRLTPRPAPLPIIIGSGTAATASNGQYDAALVQVNNILLSDTATVTPDFKLVGSDGTGTLVIILDANVPFNRNGLIPGNRINVKGVLVPDGIGGWTLKPRGNSDIF